MGKVWAGIEVTESIFISVLDRELNSFHKSEYKADILDVRKVEKQQLCQRQIQENIQSTRLSVN